MKGHLRRAEIRKGAVQDRVEAAAGTVGQLATIPTGALRDVASTLRGVATELFEIRDSTRRAANEHAPAPPRWGLGG